MTIIAQYLWLIGALIFFILGGIHLTYTFFTNKFSSRNQNVIAEMKSSYPILTKRTTMWKAWIGFNASHSMGVLFFGIINLYIAFKYFDVLQSDHFFFLLNILIAGFYVWLGKKYWFNVPFIGAFITLTCYLLSYSIIFTA
ncbi:LIC_13387 family protein [Xanthomarina sp. GH4-25]|uniref:LIC_13387 family protein n=1 Tax=Xanthomarina sp. GH4-25 TaxID=3349335 RepID=UPI003877AEEE